MAATDTDGEDRWLDRWAGARSRGACEAISKVLESLELTLKTLGSHPQFTGCNMGNELKAKKIGQEATESLPRNDNLD